MVRDAFLMGGGGMYLILGLLLLGIAMVVVWLPLGFFLKRAIVPLIGAVILLVVALSTVGTGVVTRAWGLSRMEYAIVGVTGDPEIASAIRAQGTAEANVPLAFALLAAIPSTLGMLVLGALALVRARAAPVAEHGA